MGAPKRPDHGKPPSRRGEALVCVVNNPPDWAIVREQLWYRIPVEHAPKRWPPKWLAFYQTKVFGEEAYSVRHFGRVKAIERVRRTDLFPDEPPGPKSGREYYKVSLDSLDELPSPIPSHRLRLIVFIATTLHKLMTAEEINDLFDESPLEDALWSELKRIHMPAERQLYLQCEARWFALDFAVFCRQGKLDIETDGDLWHADPARIPDDNQRNNTLTAHGWLVLRFNGTQVREQMAEYCVPQIVDAVNRLGGTVHPLSTPRTYLASEDGIVEQLRLLE